MSRKINNTEGTALVVHQDSMLTPQQEVVVLQLMTGVTQHAAAERGGVTPETVSRWMRQDAQFVAELNRRRQAVWEAHADALRSLAGRAIDTLDALLDADDERIRLAAAAAILKATALQNVGRPGGPTSEAAIRMDWMLSESIGMR